MDQLAELAARRGGGLRAGRGGGGGGEGGEGGGLKVKCLLTRLALWLSKYNTL